MQAQDEEDKRGAAEAGEEDNSGFKESQTDYKEKEYVHQEEGGNYRTKHSAISRPWLASSCNSEVIWGFTEGDCFLDSVHSPNLVYVHPLVFHCLTRCHSDRPSLAVPGAPGAVPHHCGVTWKGVSILGFAINLLLHMRYRRSHFGIRLSSCSIAHMTDT